MATAEFAPAAHVITTRYFEFRPNRTALLGRQKPQCLRAQDRFRLDFEPDTI